MFKQKKGFDILLGALWQRIEFAVLASRHKKLTRAFWCRS